MSQALRGAAATRRRAGGGGQRHVEPVRDPRRLTPPQLELLVEAGLSSREALAAATRTAAAVLGQARTLGTLEVGKTADLVVLGADPVASITAIQQVVIVIRDGRVVWRR
jgi:imidazolonepropionase-like amidohydrolase